MNLVTQPTINTCMSACISMITGINIENVIKDFHNDYFSRKGDTFPAVVKYLFEAGFDPLIDGDFEEAHVFNKDYAYVIGVESLQSKEKYHAVVLYFDEQNNLQILDPMNGVGEWYYYGVYAQDNGSVDISGKEMYLDFAIKVNS